MRKGEQGRGRGRGRENGREGERAGEGVGLRRQHALQLPLLPSLPV